MVEASEVTVLLLGDAEVGKTNFLSWITRSSIVDNRAKQELPLLKDGDQPFVFDVTFSKAPYRLEFYDTSSPESWALLSPDVLILCYDISSRSSLSNIQNHWAKLAKKIWASRTNLPVLLLGLKRDLRSEEDPNGIIYPQEGLRIAQELRCDKYMECSTRTGELVKAVFEDICRTAAMTAKPDGGLSPGGCNIM